MKRRYKILIGIAAALVALWLLGGYVGATLTVRARQSAVETCDMIGGKRVQDVSIRTEDGLTLSAWLVANSPEKAVIFLPGIGSNRRQFMHHAEYYSTLGYTLLMPDLRATGKSEGKLVSIGWHERKDLMACFRYLDDAGYTHIGADGISLGAAAICYAAKDLPDLAFVVLESSYDTMEHAVNNRLDLRHVPHFLAYPMRWFAAWKVGVSIKEMRPVDCIANCKAPTLVLGGDSEGYLKVSETQSIFDRCGAAKKQIHIFKGAHHENFLRRSPDEFKQVVGTFLDEVAATWDQPAKAA